MKKPLQVLVFLFVLFPYISFGMALPFDVQPWFAVVAFLLLLVDVHQVVSASRTGYAYFLVLACLITILLVLTVHFITEKPPLFDFLRASYKYIIIILCLLVTCIYDFCGRNLFARILKYSIIAWALVANLQFVFKKPIVGLLLPRVSFYYGRNFAIGFAPEPSFFSKLMISMLMLSNFVVYNKKDRIIINFLVIEGVFLSASLSGMLILVCYYALGLIDYFIRGISTYKKAQKRVVVALMIVFLAYFFSTKIAPLISGPEFGRITDMLERIGASGILAILNDQSFSNRLIHIDNARYVVKEGLIQGVGIPEYPSGGMFGIIYESGLFGLIFVFMMIILTIARAITGQREHRFMTLSYMVLILLLIFTDTVANPIYWFLWFETINCRIVTYPDAVGSGQSSCT